MSRFSWCLLSSYFLGCSHPAGVNILAAQASDSLLSRLGLIIVCPEAPELCSKSLKDPVSRARLCFQWHYSEELSAELAAADLSQVLPADLGTSEQQSGAQSWRELGHRGSLSCCCLLTCTEVEAQERASASRNVGPAAQAPKSQFQALLADTNPPHMHI